MTLPSSSGSLRFQLANVGALAWPSRLYFRRSAQRKIAAFPRRVVHHSFGGYELTISLEDPVGQEWYDHDWPLTPELALLGESRLTAGARVFDLGAHQGVVALMLSRLAGAAGEVIAVEAERHNFEVALRNKQLNGASNLTVLHAAAGASDGTLYFRGGLNGNVARKGRVGLARVRALTVDSLARRYGAPDVVFVDVEGYELEVLRGATSTLANAKTDFFVEVHVGFGLESLGGSAQSLLAQFDRDRYRLLVSAAGSERDRYEFRALDGRSQPPAERFFLVALAAR